MLDSVIESKANVTITHHRHSIDNNCKTKLFLTVVLTGCAALGHTKEPTRDELRQAEPVSALLLREGNHAEGGWRALRVPVHLRPRGSLHNGLPGQPAPRPQV